MYAIRSYYANMIFVMAEEEADYILENLSYASEDFYYEYALGTHTLQMNKDHNYNGTVANQLSTLNHIGVITSYSIHYTKLYEAVRRQQSLQPPLRSEPAWSKDGAYPLWPCP